MRRPTVTDALFGELPAEARLRYGLTPEAIDAVTAPRSPEGRRAGAVQRGPGPDSPGDLSKDSWLALGKRVIAEISNDRVMSVAAGVTFFGLLALFPAITAFVSIFGLVASRETIMDMSGMIQRFLPDDAAQLLIDQINAVVSAPGASLSIAMIVGLATALYSSMGGAKALIEALNVAWFETETRGFVKLNLVALTFTLGGIALIGLMILTIAVLPVIAGFFPGMLSTAVLWLRWPIMFGVLLVALAAIYRWGPAKEDAAWHWISPGALFAAVGLVVASLGFSWYAANFANYNATYGSLGAVVLLMMWLWITSMVVLIGAEINSEVERQIEIENGVTPKDASDKTSK